MAEIPVANTLASVLSIYLRILPVILIHSSSNIGIIT